jgi:hypothetical protein
MMTDAERSRLARIAQNVSDAESFVRHHDAGAIFCALANELGRADRREQFNSERRLDAIREELRHFAIEFGY